MYYYWAHDDACNEFSFSLNVPASGCGDGEACKVIENVIRSINALDGNRLSIVQMVILWLSSHKRQACADLYHGSFLCWQLSFAHNGENVPRYICSCSCFSDIGRYMIEKANQSLTKKSQTIHQASGRMILTVWRYSCGRLALSNMAVFVHKMLDVYDVYAMDKMGERANSIVDY